MADGQVGRDADGFVDMRHLGDLAVRERETRFSALDQPHARDAFIRPRFFAFWLHHNFNDGAARAPRRNTAFILGGFIRHQAAATHMRDIVFVERGLEYGASFAINSFEFSVKIVGLAQAKRLHRNPERPRRIGGGITQ